MKEYHKIDSLYERDMLGTRKLIEGKYRSPLVEYLKDNEWIFTEKVDGTNIRVCWDGHKITFGGRTENAQIPNNLVNKLNEMFLTNEVEELFEQKFGEVEVILFGEGYGAKIQACGGLYSDTAEFILFDVTVGGIYLDRENVEDIGKAFSLKCVPVISELKTIEDAVKFIKGLPISRIAKSVKVMEGVVGTPKVRINDHRGNRIIVKIKVEDYEKNN